ncbi:MAG: 4Fe-4S binding protein [Lentimicrobiaceae bacterium]
MARKRQSPLNYYRITLQWGIFALLIYMILRPLLDKNYIPDYEAYCPLGGMQSLASYFSIHSLACSMTTVQIALGVALILGVVLFSKLFCSYICPIGTFTEWMGTLGRKAKMHITLTGNADRMLRALKYVLLFITFYFTVTASELFCRKFDPFYASFTGFSGDVVLWYAIPALVLTIAGSFFIRQFWCKYLCPLGAVTNIAVYALPAAAITLLWVLLTYAAGLVIPWPWLLGALCLMGFIFEATTLKFFVFPSLRITRNDDLCTHCRICDNKCPMAIQISNVVTVDHIDCHLCVDCVVKCPEKGALTINKRNLRWLPAVATVILTAAAITIATFYELPTISENWGELNGNNVKIVRMDGLKNIKCFGSSRSFANHMKEIPGVLGVETFVKHHRVVVYFDESIINAEGVKEAIFSPLSELLNYNMKTTGMVSFVKLGIDRCFDPNDQFYLGELLRKDKGVLALSTSFGEPVQATIYYDASLTYEDKIIAAASAELLLLGEGNEQTTIETGFVVNNSDKTSGEVQGYEFARMFIPVTDVSFNHYESFTDSEMLVYELPFEQAADPSLQQWMPYLVSHASNDDGIVRIQTSFAEDGPVIKIWFVNSITTVEKINTLLKSSELIVHYPDKSDKRIKNPFDFPIE